MKNFKENLVRLMEERGFNKKSLSLATGKNETLVRDVLTNTGSPRYDTVSALAKALGVSVPQLMGDAETQPYSAPIPPALPDNITEVVRYDAALSAGPGSLIDPNAEPLGVCHFETQWLKTVTRAVGEQLAVVRVDGDSMEPTLADGDWILIDRTQTRINREGVYALQIGDMVWIKRISLNLSEKLVRVISDNTNYPVQELEESELQILGRAVWIVGRKV